MLSVNCKEKIQWLKAAGVFATGATVMAQVLSTGLRGARGGLTILYDKAYQAQDNMNEVGANGFICDFFEKIAPPTHDWCIPPSIPRYGNFVLHYSSAADFSGVISDDMPDLDFFEPLVRCVQEHAISMG